MGNQDTLQKNVVKTAAIRVLPTTIRFKQTEKSSDIYAKVGKTVCKVTIGLGATTNCISVELAEKAGVKECTL